MPALASHLVSVGSSFGFVGPVWVSFCQEFELVFSTWLSSSQFVNLLSGAGVGGLPFGFVTPGVVLSFDLVPGGVVGSGPLGVASDLAILSGLSSFPGWFLTSAGLGGVGVWQPSSGPVYGSYLIGGDLGSLLAGGVTSAGGPLGRAWLLDLGLRLQLGMRVSFPGGVPVFSPSGVPVINVFGVLCLA